MKTLSQALRDGDRIDALLRETCVNSDGRTQGIALPSAEAQVSLMRTAYKNAGLDLSKAEDRPQYIEAHGEPLVIDKFFVTNPFVSLRNRYSSGRSQRSIRHCHHVFPAWRRPQSST